MGSRIIHEKCNLKGHIFELELANNAICERYLNKDGTASHILCDCEQALAN
jgi:hypothetical protein